jgi:hypothetical protein
MGKKATRKWIFLSSIYWVEIDKTHLLDSYSETLRLFKIFVRWTIKLNCLLKISVQLKQSCLSLGTTLILMIIWQSRIWKSLIDCWTSKNFQDWYRKKNNLKTMGQAKYIWKDFSILELEAITDCKIKLLIRNLYQR